MPDSLPSESVPSADSQERSVAGLLGRLGKESLVYGLLTAAASFASLLALPLITSELAPPSYGAVALALVMVGLLVGLSGLGLDFSAARWFYDEDSAAWRSSVIAVWFWTQLGVSVLLAATLAISAPWISALVGLPGEGTNVLLMAALMIPLAGVRQVVAGWFRFRREPVRAAVVLGGSTVLSVIGMVTFVVVVPWGAVGAIFGQVLAGFLVALACIATLGRSISPRNLSAGLFSAMLKFGFPLLPGVLAAWILTWSDRVILGILTGGEEVGLYALAASIAFSIGLLTAAIRLAWAPFVYSLPEDEFSRDVIARGALWVLWVGFFAAAGLSALAPLVVRLLAAPAYQSASTALPALAFSEVTVIMAALFATGAGIARRPLAITISVTVAAALNVGLNFALIPIFGFNGAAIATLLAGLVGAVVIYQLSQRLYRISFSTAKFLVIGTCAVALAAASQIFADDTVAGISARVALVATMLFVPFVLGMIHLKDLRYSRRKDSARKASG